MANRQIDMVVTVKAYPAIGSKTGEAVCVAGVERDTGEWIRLFPVHFRDLPEDKQFSKWQRVRVTVRRPNSDKRPESWQPDARSIELLERLPAGEAVERRNLVGRLPERTMCELNQLNKLVPGRNPATESLGVVRPLKPPKFVIKSRSAADIETSRLRQEGQLPIFTSATDKLEVIDYVFLYRYLCRSMGCKGHEQSIIDWEIAQAYRSWRSNPNWQELMRRKWEDEMWAPERDAVLFVGNQHNQANAFMVLSVFWPPGGPLQAGLAI